VSHLKKKERKKEEELIHLIGESGNNKQHIIIKQTHNCFPFVA
jgi:hypothetical protein